MKKLGKNLLILFVLFFSFQAEARSGVVLALSGGGLRGVAHAGAVKVLMDNNIPIVGIVGTSMGSLMGGLLAVGYSPDEVREIVEGIDLASMLAEHTGQLYVPTGQGASSNSSYWLRKTKTGDQEGPLGFFAAIRLFDKFTDLVSNVDVVDFMKLPIPFAAVATDLDTGEKIVLRSGSVAAAMRASMAIPGVFEPWSIGGKLLVDGGLVSNLPVATAKELFPGFPIIAVDVSDVPGSTGKVQSMFDVLDRSLTILTFQNVAEEKRLADIVIKPNVHKFGIFEQSMTGEIFNEGVLAANEKIESIIALVDNSTAPSERELQKWELDDNKKLVSDIIITGVDDNTAKILRSKYTDWIGKPIDTRSVIAASKEIAKRDDVLTADYTVLHNEDDDNIAVVIAVVPLPEWDFGISGYTSNLHPYRWVELRGVKRNLFKERDSLSGSVFLGEDWGVDLAYRTAPAPLDFWEMRTFVENWVVSPVNSDAENWRRYAVGISRSFRLGKFDMSFGYAYEYMNGANDNNQNSSGPTFALALNTLDVPSDPTSGSAVNIAAWWSNFDSFMYRVNFFKPFKIGDVWRANLRLGFAEGNSEEPGHAIYLGAAEELYSVAGRPIMGERAAWANVAFRRVFGKSIFGSISGEIFGGFGYVWDREGVKVDDPWEAGLAISVPNNLFDAKIAIFYTSESELRFGFFLGNPVWDRYPLP